MIFDLNNRPVTGKAESVSRVCAEFVSHYKKAKAGQSPPRITLNEKQFKALEVYARAFEKSNKLEPGEIDQFTFDGIKVEVL